MSDEQLNLPVDEDGNVIRTRARSGVSMIVNAVSPLSELIEIVAATQFVKDDDYEAVSSSDEDTDSDESSLRAGNDSEDDDDDDAVDAGSLTLEQALARYAASQAKLREAKGTIASLIDQVSSCHSFSLFIVLCCRCFSPFLCVCRQTILTVCTATRLPTIRQ